MTSRIIFLLRLGLFFILYFIFARLFFQIYEWSLTSKLSISDILLSYVHGLRLDLSLTGYLLLLISVLTILSVFIHNKWFKYIINTLVIVLIIIFSTIIVVDVELYRFWGFRMDTSPLMYLDNPDLALASTPVSQIILLLFVLLVYNILFIWLYLKLVARRIEFFTPLKWFWAPSFIVIAGLMILPIRGSLGIAPINSGNVYFSKNIYANHCALNVCWNFFYDVANFNKTSFTANYLANKQVQDICKAEIEKNKPTNKYILKNNRPNVVIIILESFSAKAIGALGGDSRATPNLNQLWSQGVAFNNMYANASRSDKGLVSIMSGFPTHPRASVMMYPKKTQKIRSINDILEKQGYESAFYYGGDTEFASMISYVRNAGYNRIINEDDFAPEMQNEKWGVHDEFVFDRLLNDIDTARQPFFKTVFTLSSHEPYDVPMKTVINGDDNDTKYLNSIFYTDSCLGGFINEAKKRDWYQNTVFILIADHSVNNLNNNEIDKPIRYAIPMLWIGGALNDTMQVNEIGNQYDLSATLLTQMHLDASDFAFSRNLITTNNNGGYALYVFNRGFGLITPKGNVVYDIELDKFTSATGDTTNMSTKAKALFQNSIEVFNHL